MKHRSLLFNLRVWGVLGLFLTLIWVGYRQGVTGFFFAAVTVVEVILLFNILIIVHELGHFLAARWRGLQVDKFAIWFGKPLWSKKINGVEYILGSVPAGGYVALPQMAPMETIEGKTETPRENLPPAFPLNKIIVALAGPLFSFGLALVFATLVWMVGKPVGTNEKSTTIGYALPGGPADKAGLRPGDIIRSIDGHSVSRWAGVPDGVTWRVMTSDFTTAGFIPIVVDRAGHLQTFKVKPEIDLKEHHWWERSVPARIQIVPAEKEILVGKVYPNSPAAYAGLRDGDRLLALKGIPLYSYFPVIQQMKDDPKAPLELTIERGGARWVQSIQPVRPLSPKVLPRDGPQTDIGIDLKDATGVVMDHPAPWSQVGDSVEMVRSTLVALVTPHSNVSASQLSGPVGIMNLFYRVLSSDNGWRLALWLAVVINVNLAILNLFPFPILDGGHIVLSLIEWIRRRPLSMSVLEPIQTVCAVALMSYMAYITFFDAQDFRHLAFDNDEVKFAPQPPTAP